MKKKILIVEDEGIIALKKGRTDVPVVYCPGHAA